jgi:hypothetical protein
MIYHHHYAACFNYFISFNQWDETKRIFSLKYQWVKQKEFYNGNNEIEWIKQIYFF